MGVCETWFGLHVNGKQTGVGSIPFRFSFLFKSVVVRGRFLIVILFFHSEWNSEMAHSLPNNAGVIQVEIVSDKVRSPI